MRRLAASLVLLAAACGPAGPEAPSPGAPALICDADVCLAYPGDWAAEPGVGYIGFSHPSAPDDVTASTALVNMEAIAAAAGVAWPVPAEDVVRAFWQLIEDADAGELGAIERRQGGSIESFGTSEGLRLWHLLVPVDTTRAIAVEVRAPNATWESHAEVFFSEVVPAP
jgi:hypothetical protein